MSDECTVKMRQMAGMGREQWPKEARDEKPSRKWRPMRKTGTSEYGAEWENERYVATLHREVTRLRLFGASTPLLCIGISNMDQTARHDWRDFQRIKNDIAGEEWEAIELYPAESRLIDPSNRFYLWCYPKGAIEFGLPFDGRRVFQPREAVAPQRGFYGGESDFQKRV